MQPIDRLADLETGLSAVNRALVSRSDRRPQLATFLQTWPAETREAYDGTYSYPGPTDTDSDQLPVVTLGAELVAGAVTWTDRSEHPVITAWSPVGWLPPGTRVEIGWDGRRYRIVRAPTRLHGRNAAAISSAGWGSYLGYSDACRQLTMGTGTIHVFTESSAGVLVPQYYQGGAAVEMPVYNTSQAVTANKLLTVDQDRHNRWVVTIEPCSLSCSEE